MTATADHRPWELSFPAAGVPSPNDPARNQCIYPRTELSCHEREGRMPPWMGVPCTDWISLWEMGQAAASCSPCTHMETLEAAPRLRAKPVSPNILPGSVTSHGYSGKCGSIRAAWLHPSLGYIHPDLSDSNLGISALGDSFGTLLLTPDMWVLLASSSQIKSGHGIKYIPGYMLCPLGLSWLLWGCIHL